MAKLTVTVTALALSCIAAIVSAEDQWNSLAHEDSSSDSVCLIQSSVKPASAISALEKVDKKEEKEVTKEEPINATLAHINDTISKLDEYKTAVPIKNKVTLMILEVIPVLGCLGVDRLYLDCMISGLVKLGVCIFTCFIGGVIWGAIDGIAILVNALTSQTSIDTLGMVADFGGSDIQKAKIIGWVMLGLWIAFGVCGCLSHRVRPTGTSATAAKTPGGNTVVLPPGTVFITRA